MKRIMIIFVAGVTLFMTFITGSLAAPKDKLKLTNTSKTEEALATSPQAIHLRNALIDTSEPAPLRVPAGLKVDKTDHYLLQFKGPIEASWIEELKKAGVTFFHYVPNNAYAVRVPEGKKEELKSHPQVQWMGNYEPYFKLEESLLEEALGGTSAQGGQYREHLVSFFYGEAEEGIKVLSALGVEVGPVERTREMEVATVSFAPSQITSVCHIPEVMWIEPKPKKVLHNDLSFATMSVTPVVAAHPTLNGSGVIVSVNDTGCDDTHRGYAIDPSLPTSYPSNNTRIIQYLAPGGTQGDDNGHGSHTSGSILSNGANSSTAISVPGSSGPPYGVSQFQGMAPAAQLIMVEIFNSVSPPETELMDNAVKNGGQLSSNSWGFLNAFTYDSSAALWDGGVRDAMLGTTGDQPLIVFFSAGNDGAGQTNGTGGKADTVSSPATAKNVITIGASELTRSPTNYNSPQDSDTSSQLAYFSSRGPVDPGVEGSKGRFKPDLVAPGMYVISHQSSQVSVSPDVTFGDWDFAGGNVRTGPSYAFLSGTSMSCPLACGIGAILYQYYSQVLLKTPSPALLKALLINGARSLGSLYDFNTSASIIFQGWGMIDLEKSLDGPFGTSDPYDIVTEDQNDHVKLQTNGVYTRFVDIGFDDTPLKITLVWTDPAGNPASGIKLVNNLNLRVKDPAGITWFGNNFSAQSIWSSSGGSGDAVNNVENVFIEKALTGRYTVDVTGANVPTDARTDTTAIDQDFALVISGARVALQAASTPTLFEVRGVTDPIQPGQASDVKVYAMDANGKIVANYTGTISFASSDLSSFLPANYTFSAADKGVHLFSQAVRFSTPGEQSLTVTDMSNSSITGSVTNITVAVYQVPGLGHLGLVTVGVALLLTGLAMLRKRRYEGS